jgi:dipeptidyl aminopeptidase B
MAKGGEDLLMQEQSQPLTQDEEREETPRPSGSSLSTTSLVLEHMSDKAFRAKEALYNGSANGYRDRHGKRDEDYEGEEIDMDMEDQLAWKRSVKPADRKAKRVFLVLIAIGLLGWVAAAILFARQGRHKTAVDRPHDPHATNTVGHGKKVTLEQVLTGQWSARHHEIRWIAGPKGEDGLLLERGGSDGRDYLVVEDVRYRGDSLDVQKKHSRTLMEKREFDGGGRRISVNEAWPNVDFTKVLVRSDYQDNWRHSGTGTYWIFDVDSQTAEALDPDLPDGRIQLASWSPKGDVVVFTRDNDMFLRRLDEKKVMSVTNDGGPELFNGVPDWVYEEEVFQTDSATWWSGDGKYIAFLRTDESKVPEFPVQYYFSRPSGIRPAKGEETYPDVVNIKYPKAGAPMSVVSLQIYDVEKEEVFWVPIDDDFEDDDRLITEVVWAGDTGRLLVRSTNRESDQLKMILIDAEKREGKTVRERDVLALDGGWFEISETTTYVPADPKNGRDEDGYIDTVIHGGYDHLAYFSPLDNPEPKMLTQGKWEVVKAPSAVALDQNLVYFVATKDGSTQRHIYTVDLQGGPDSIEAITDTSDISYYGASFSKGASYMLLSYQGPRIPWQKVLSTPSNRQQSTDILIEDNNELESMAKKTELPIEIYQTITIDGVEMNLVERRPPHFDDSGKKKYPVLFFLYNGPGFQHVNHRFTIDFQSFVASSLGYIVVTLDARGTGFLGRDHRCIIRGNIGYWEAHDQIEAAKMWAKKKYVDAEKMAIWGWSYGGFMTLKVLETDGGETFKYGMAVAPVTDWRFYDSIYTERYMHTPQHNPGGYDNASITNVANLSKNVKFLVMHGASDDNVHFQNTLALLDKLDLGGVRNYDVHVFPDSDHSIYFHGANGVVYGKLRDWLVNAFNGEWLRTDKPEPAALGGAVEGYGMG